MSERGTFALDRGWFNHPAFASEPFTEREAWAWLIANAAYKDHVRRVGTFTVDLKRGQAAGSVRFLAEEWQWSKSRVDRFLDRLKKRDMLTTDAGTGILVITLCNYDKHQPQHTANGTGSGHEAGQERDRSGTKENKGINPSGERARERARESASDWPDDFASQIWEAYGQGREKKVSMQALLELKRSRKVPWQVFLDGVKRQAENVEVQYRPSLQRFIKREKWCDEYTPTSATGPPQQPSQRSLALVPINGHQTHAIREDRKPNPIGTLLGRIEARAARKRERGAFGSG
jgi:hypothetical protein